MLPLSANSDFKQAGFATNENPYRDWNGENLNFKAEIYGTDALDQAIEAVLVTEPGERLFNPEFYSPFYKLLFENETDAEALIENVFQQIETWVDVTIDRTNAGVTIDSFNHTVELSIPYFYDNGRARHIFSRVISK